MRFVRYSGFKDERLFILLYWDRILWYSALLGVCICFPSPHRPTVFSDRDISLLWIWKRKVLFLCHPLNSFPLSLFPPPHLTRNMHFCSLELARIGKGHELARNTA